MTRVAQDKTFLSNNLNTVADFCEREYWTGIWIVQELAHGRDVVIHCGSSTMSYDSFLTFNNALDKVIISKPRHNQDLIQEMHRFQMKIFGHVNAPISQLKQHEKPLALSDLRHVLAQRKCQDPRDKIFGLHSLLDSCIQD